MKKVVKLFLFSIVSVLMISQLSCKDDDDSNSNCENLACTDIFITIIISIQDQNQNPIALDSFEVINLDDDSDATITLSPSEFNEAQLLGQYPLIHDGGIGVNQELQLQFKGYVDAEEVISAEYTVASDCCHVNLVTGNLQLIL